MEKSDIREQVEEFMILGKQEVKLKPEVPQDNIVRLRASLIMEEVLETLSSLFAAESEINNLKEQIKTLINNAEVNVDLVELADGTGDIDVVVEGTRLAFGINGKPIADEIHKTNMAKFAPGSWIREDGKIMKPPDWIAPNIKKLLIEQGMNDDEPV